MLARSTIRSQAIVLAGTSWAVLAWSQLVTGPLDRLGILRGVDFVHFYTSALAVHVGDGPKLYEWERAAQLLPTAIPGVDVPLYLPIYPPQLALLMAPLASMHFLVALGVWTAVSFTLYCVAVYVGLSLLPRVQPYRFEAWVLALGFPPFLQLLSHGQVAALAVLGLVVAWWTFQAGRVVLMGLVLGALAFKPQLGVFALVAFAAMPSWKLGLGLGVSLAGQLFAVASVLGWEIWGAYVETVWQVWQAAEFFEPKLWMMHNLRAAVSLLLGRGLSATVVWLIGGVGVLLLGRRVWRVQQSAEVRFASLCLVAILLNPHLYVYDLVLLAVPLGLIASWLLSLPSGAPSSLPALSYLLVWLPLLGPLASFTHVQLTTPVVVGVLILLGRQTPAVAPQPA